jgi:transcription initiation factor TFIID TATA-box-binding protein
MKIVNIVATVILKKPLNLTAVHEHLPDSKFAKSGAPWLQYRVQPENYYTAFYKSGKFLITGVKSLDEIEPIAYRILKILKKYHISAEIKTVRIHNFVVVDALGYNVQLDKLLVSLHHENIEYEPEQFPGLIIKEGSHSILLFSSGKIILTGLKESDSIEPVLAAFKEKIERTQQ